MFKSKLNFKIFDKRAQKTPHLTTVAVKNRARACCGRLSNRLGTTTPFYLILDYFDDQPGEPKGHFIDFGNHTTLHRHFEKVEIKPGGTQKRFSGSVKQVAMGEAFVQEKEGQQVVYFVPLQSKIPTSGWNRFLKKAKPLLGNRPGIVLTEKEWKAMQAPAEAPNPLEKQLTTLQTDLNELSTNKEALSKEAFDLQLATHKATLQQLINTYKTAPANGGVLLQEVVAQWRALATVAS